MTALPRKATAIAKEVEARRFVFLLLDRFTMISFAGAIEPLRAHRVSGQRVVLIDDVMTTGATLHTAAGVLHRAGAAQVSALVVARTP